MKDMSWIEMMKKAQEIRLFTSLQIKRAQKGGITSAQELDLLSRIVLSDAELTPLELTVLTGLSKSAVSRLIEHLERKELLQKKYNSSTSVLRGIGRYLFLNFSRSFVYSPFHFCICKVCIFLQSSHNFRCHIINRSHRNHQPFLSLQQFSYSPLTCNSESQN